MKRRWAYSILVIKHQLDRRSLNLDGSHALAKKGGEQVAYQGRKNGKTTNILPMTDAQGYVITATDLIAGNHHDDFNLKAHLQQAFGWLKRLGIPLLAVYFNADSAFDTLPARKVCFNYGLIPNIAENKRNRKCVKRGRKRLFNPDLYKKRFVSERSFAWIDKFRALLLRFDRLDALFLGAHHLAFAMINLRHVFADLQKSK